MGRIQISCDNTIVLFFYGSNFGLFCFTVTFLNMLRCFYFFCCFWICYCVFDTFFVFWFCCCVLPVMSSFYFTNFCCCCCCLYLFICFLCFNCCCAFNFIDTFLVCTAFMDVHFFPPSQNNYSKNHTICICIFILPLYFKPQQTSWSEKNCYT